MIPQAPGIADQHVSVACGLLPACRADYSMVTAISQSRRMTVKL